jgi:hypothetical protein
MPTSMVIARTGVERTPKRTNSTSIWHGSATRIRADAAWPGSDGGPRRNEEERMAVARLEARSTVAAPAGEGAMPAADGAGGGARAAVPRVRVGASPQPTLGPDRTHLLIAAALLLAGLATAWWVMPALGYRPPTFEPAPGISLFAIFFILAQALERLNEFITLAWPGAGATTVQAGAKKTKALALAERDRAVAEEVTKLAEGEAADAERCAAKQAVVDRIRANRAVLFWALPAAITFVGCGLLDLHLLRTVGVKAAPAWLDLLLTGLAVGGGTKPLHDLIANLEKAKEKKEDPPETGGAR